MSLLVLMLLPALAQEAPPPPTPPVDPVESADAPDTGAKDEGPDGTGADAQDADTTETDGDAPDPTDADDPADRSGTDADPEPAEARAEPGTEPDAPELTDPSPAADDADDADDDSEGTDAEGTDTAGATDELPAEPPPPEPLPPVLEISVRDADTDGPLFGMSLIATQGDDVRSFVTDEQGRVRTELPPGEWTLELTGGGYEPESVTATLANDRATEIAFRPVLAFEADELAYEIDVVGRKLAPEITERILSSEEIRYLPGTNGDPVRVVQNLPGVARPPLNIGQLLIRGTAPEDSAYYLDGAAIPNVFHFAGLSTVLPAEVIDEIAFLPGNYGVRYGRTLGGVVDIRTGSELPEQSNGFLAVDLFQTTAYVQQRLNDRNAISFSGRRSYIDAVLNPVLNAAGDAAVRAPRYYDGQFRWLAKTPSGGSFDLLWLSSDDRFRVLGQDADDQDQVQIGLTTWFHKLRLQSRETVGIFENELSFTGGPENQSFAVAPDGEAYERPFRYAFRDELTKPIGSGWFGARLGVDMQGGTWKSLYDVPAFGVREEADELTWLPAAYAEATVRTGPVKWIPGIRGDVATWGSYSAAAVDPRLAVQVGEDVTVVKASYGRYSQFPGVREAIERPRLQAQSSWQASVGWDQRWTPIFDTELTGYANRLTDLVVGREDAFRFFTGPPPVGPLDTDPYANDGVGRIYGVEALARVTADNTVGWVSATVGRSLRTNRPGQDEVLFEYDQPVILTAVGSQQLPKRWRLGARVRSSVGNPYTPVVNRIYSLDDRSYVPVYGERDSARLPTFASVDVRVDKEWQYDKWALAFYLDLQNATNAQNVEVMSWNFDYSEEDPVTSIPVVPAFGLKGSW